MKRRIPLEPAAEAVCEQGSVPPLIFQLPPDQGRMMLEMAQLSPVYLYPADSAAYIVSTGKWGRIPLYFVYPKESDRIRRIIFYIHGAGWVFGSFHTHEKLIRELAARTNSLIVFPEYSRSPESKYPVAIEQCYYVLSQIREFLQRYNPKLASGLCENALTVAGDSVGGNMAIAMQLMSEMRSGPKIQKLLLYYPVTNACFDTPSYHEFATDYYLYRAGMQWFWQQYAPCESDRKQITSSPLRTDLSRLKTFPQTMIIGGQADVLRSEGEAFAEKLLCAGVDITALQIPGTIHDFVMLNALNQTNACRIAMDASTAWLNR